MRESDSSSVNDTAFSEDSFKPTQIYRTLSAPISLQWELTDWCNQKCFHCYNYWRKDTDPSADVIPELDDTFRIIANEIIANHVFSVTITGGEPLPFLKNMPGQLDYLKMLV